ncbi:MAG TPA: phage integrase N-terminal SAM-like domain-containing protein, partial [Ktedonobacteraceae bacterium]|nr:phage integrase N-terminal SAM-like domain-containing protein [Ktedonobacteraceae bacterium]
GKLQKMMGASNILSFPQSGAEPWIREYQETRLSKRDEATIDAYTRILRQFTEWVAKRPGHGKQFEPTQLTNTVVEAYLACLEEQGYSVSHRTRVKSVIKHFCQWLIEEKEALKRNPTNAITIKTPQQLAPRILSPDQRFVLRNLVEKANDIRGQALFALGYWAGCRASDVSYLLMEYTHVGPKIGWLHVGHKGGKFRDIDLLNEARRPLYAYIERGGRERDSLYVLHLPAQSSSH